MQTDGIEFVNLGDCILTRFLYNWLPACSEGYKWWSHVSRSSSSCSSRRCYWACIRAHRVFHNEMCVWCSTQAALSYTGCCTGRVMWESDRFSVGSYFAIQWILHCSEQSKLLLLLFIIERLWYWHSDAITMCI